MGFIIGRSKKAPELETKKTARYGEQKVVATETPLEQEAPEVIDFDPAEQEAQPEEEVKEAVSEEVQPEVEPEPEVKEESEPEVKKPVRRTRKTKKG